MHDVIVIGGSYAGASAAIQLGRARRDVVVLDDGARRNRFASHAHGFLGQDGVPPGDIAAKGRAEALAYPTVRWTETRARGAAVIDGGFAVHTDEGELRARRLVLATGVTDELPDVPGLRERWGASVFHCPYCHGYELDRGPLAVLATSPLSAHHATLVAEWSVPGGTTFFADATFPLEDAQRDALSARDIRIEHARVVRVEDGAEGVALRLDDDRVLGFAGLFLLPRAVLRGDFAAQLGCELEPGGHGPIYKTNLMKETTVPGVFACGDAATFAGSLAIAVAEGVRAGVGAHQSLVFAK